MTIETGLVVNAGKTFDRQQQEAEKRSLIFCFGKTFLGADLRMVLLKRNTLTETRKT